MPRVRLATREDVPAILEISNWAAVNTPANFAVEAEPLDAWEASFDETHEMYPWFVAVDEDDVVGFARASPWKGRCAYAFSVETTVYVQPDHHGQGIGRALYEWLLAMLQAQGYRSVVGGITLPNDASVGLHESFGMTCVAVFKGIGWKFDRWHDVGYWMGALAEGDDPPPARLLSVQEVVSAE